MKVEGGKKLTEQGLVNESAHVTNSDLGSWTEVGDRVLMDNVQLGDYSYVQNDVDIVLANIGKFVSIASHVRINPSNHPWWRPSLHHFSYRPQKFELSECVDNSVFEWRAENRVDIGHDVWIGHGAIIMSGVNIGNGAIVGSGSVVTKDVPAWTIVVGNPARVLRPRFDNEEYALQLEQLAWWHWPHAKLKQFLPLFQQDCQAFLAAAVGETS